MKKIILLFTAIFCGLCSPAQDIIITKESKRIDAKVLEINTDQVKYTDFNDSVEIVLTITKCQIASIIFANGSVEVFPECEQQPPANNRQKLTGTVWKSDTWWHPVTLIFLSDYTARITDFQKQTFDCTYTIDNNGFGEIIIRQTRVVGGNKYFESTFVTYDNRCDFYVNGDIFELRHWNGRDHALKRVNDK